MSSYLGRKNKAPCPIKVAKDHFKPDYRIDEEYVHDDGLNAFRGILGVCGAMLVIFVMLILILWA